MEDLVNISKDFFEKYIESFRNITEEQKKNFNIKKNHSLRVAENARWLAIKLEMGKTDEYIAYLIGLLHDIGRFVQLSNQGAIMDDKSFDHADQSVKILRESEIFIGLSEEYQQYIYYAIQLHNKLQLPKKKLSAKQLMYAQLLRDADKLDILEVLTVFYTNRNQTPNHTLSWELPRGTAVSKGVAREALLQKTVTKAQVKNQIDVKIMQLSWVYDLNFSYSFEHILKHRFLEKIYDTLTKTDTIIEIYRKTKVYAENIMYR